MKHARVFTLTTVFVLTASAAFGQGPGPGPDPGPAPSPGPDAQECSVEALLMDCPEEPLSEREMEVLQLIADGLTNQEIATRLFLTLNTVKVHTRNIYGKLDAHSRTQAVARARALGFFPPSNRSDA